MNPEKFISQHINGCFCKASDPFDLVAFSGFNLSNLAYGGLAKVNAN